MMCRYLLSLVTNDNRLGKVAQWAQCSLGKHEDVNSDTLNPCEGWVGAVTHYNPSTLGKLATKDSQISKILLTIESCISWQDRELLKKTLDVIWWPIHTNANAYTHMSHTYRHRQEEERHGYKNVGGLELSLMGEGSGPCEF